MQSELQDGGLELQGGFNMVNFDIMVSTEAIGSKGGSGGITVYDVVQIGGKREVSSTKGTVNRIKFSVGYSSPRQEHYKHI